MPELPEVETIRKGLVNLVGGAVIIDVAVFWDRMITPPFSTERFKTVLRGEQINTIERRGKYLIFLLDHWAMISHLRMEGKYEVSESGEPIKKHTHVIFYLTDGRQLRYLDVRKCGKFTLLPIEKRDDYEPFKKMGPEPTADFFKLSKFKKDLAKSHRAIKAVILDQNIVAGVGNIYADESLFQARIHPLQAADTIGPAAAKRLQEAIIDVISRSVEAGGATIRTYKNTLGEAGKFQVSLAVYGQTGQPCPNCGHPIEKIRVAQRGTHYCPHCQQLSKTRSKAADITDVAYKGAR